MSRTGVLFYDLETSPNLSYTWGVYEQNVIKVVKGWELLSFAYKWQGEDTVHCITREGQESDGELTRKLWELLNSAQTVVAHNADAFDNKKAAAKFLEHGLPPTRAFKSIDTLKIARNKFKLNSNGLDALGELLGVGRKLKTPGFGLWVGCMADDAKCWATMAKYNKQDVVLLEKVFNVLIEWKKPKSKKFPVPRVIIKRVKI